MSRLPRNELTTHQSSRDRAISEYGERPIKRCFSIVLLLYIILLITGCVFAPGYKTPQGVSLDVEITPITGELVSELTVKPESIESEMADLIQNSKEQGYRIGPYDILSISLWDFYGPRLDITPVQMGETRTTGYVVAEDGTIFFPFAGRVRVAGKTPEQVRRILAESIKDTILEPQIDVKVIDYRSRKVYITGEVATPGQQPISDMPLTILDAISLTGGPTENADLTSVKLNREGTVHSLDLLALLKDGKLQRNVMLQNGDIVNVPNNSSRKVYVIGEVLRPSSLVMTDHRLSLTEAINDVGGINPITSNPARIYVIRGNPITPDIYQLNAEDPTALVLGDYFPLRPHDVVYVDSSGLTRWSRVLNQILPSATFFGQPDLFTTGSQ